MDFKNWLPALKSGHEVLDVSSSLLDGLQTAYQFAQRTRLTMFLGGCERALQEYGAITGDQNLRLRDLVTEGDFCRDHVYDFMKQVVDSNSKVAQFALARLYVRCATRKPVPMATKSETILMRAYRDLEDRDVDALILVNEISAEATKYDYSINFYQRPANRLEMRVTDFNPHASSFQEMGFANAHEVATLMDTFAQKSIVDRLPTFQQGPLDVLLFSYGKSPRTEEFLADLRWACGCVR